MNHKSPISYLNVEAPKRLGLVERNRFQRELPLELAEIVLRAISFRAEGRNGEAVSEEENACECMRFMYEVSTAGPWEWYQWAYRTGRKPSLQAADVYVKHTGTAKGRGVYARNGFATGTLVEEIPLVLFASPFELPKVLADFAWNWQAAENGPHGRAPLGHTIALGFGSLYNHDDPPNLRREEDRVHGVFRFWALRPIAADEELTVDYGKRHFEKRRLVPIQSGRSPENRQED